MIDICTKKQKEKKQKSRYDTHVQTEKSKIEVIKAKYFLQNDFLKLINITFMSVQQGKK